MRIICFFAMLPLLAACGSVPTTETPPPDVDSGDDAGSPPTCTPEGCLEAASYHPACASMACTDDSCVTVDIRPEGIPCPIPGGGEGACNAGVCK